MSRRSTRALVIHCTATLAHQDFHVQEIEAMHRRRGWSQIGYHYLIDLDGTVEIGRKPDSSVGAHVGGFNSETLGIAYVGGLRSSDAKPVDTRTEAQTKSMIELCKKLLKKYPSALILGHRDFSPDLDGDGKIEKHEFMKECPCFDAGPWAVSVGLPGGAYLKGQYKRLKSYKPL
jgi:N-acetylmuramoyl-L-alanine amidase